MNDLLAHGLGGSTDLPIPFTYALIGASWALTASFAVVAFAWRTPRLNPNSPGITLPRWCTSAADSVILREAAGGLGLIAALWVVAAGMTGAQESSRNALPGAFYVLLWVGVVAASLLLGPVWRYVSPFRTLHRWGCVLTHRSSGAGVAVYPESWGYRPGVIGLFAFVWLELASPEPGSVSAILVWLAVYGACMIAGGIAFGDTWFARGDPFEVYSDLASRLSVWGRDRLRCMVIRSPLDNLDAMPVRAGSVALMATLLGSTAFDSVTAFPSWMNLQDRLSEIVPGTVVRTVGLLVFILVVGVTFWGAARATGGMERRARSAMPGELSHSLIPIIVGYVFAHYLTYLVEKGQATVVLLSDPLGQGWSVWGLADAHVSYVLSEHPGATATVKVLCVLTGHVLGVIAAHDKSLRLLPARNRLTGQLALLLTMVGYTFSGLYLMFGG